MHKFSHENRLLLQSKVLFFLKYILLWGFPPKITWQLRVIKKEVW